MTRIATSLGIGLLIAGCSSDTGSDGSCSCEPKAALETKYDNMSSMLGAENVQDALDELAARPVAEAPVGPRMIIVEEETPNTGADVISANGGCPDQAHDVALGGACIMPPLPGVALVGSILGEGGYACKWRQPMGNTDPVTVQVRCLLNAR